MPLTTYTAGEVLTAASLNANFAAAGGLQFIKSQTIGTTVGSVTVTGAFSTTYDNYLIIVNGGVASADNVIAMTLGATATGYYHRSIYGTYSSTTNTVDNAQNASSWSIVGSASADNIDLLCQIRQPFASKTTTFTAQTARSATNGLVISSGGYLANTTSYTAFTLTPNTGTLTGGTIYVYGYAKS